MSGADAIGAAVAPVVAAWLRTSPGQPLVLRADAAGGVEARIGLSADCGARITGGQAATLLGISYQHFSRMDFFGLDRGSDRRFSRLAVERLKQRRSD